MTSEYDINTYQKSLDSTKFSSVIILTVVLFSMVSILSIIGRLYHAYLFTLAYLLIGWGTTWLLCKEYDKKYLIINLFMTAFLIRYLVVLITCLTASHGSILHMTPDEEHYFQQGIEIAKRWRKVGFGNLLMYKDLVGSKNFLQYLVNGVHIYFLGHQIIFPRITCSFIDSLCAILIYRIGARYTSYRLATLACLFVVLNPQLIYWSSRNFHDPLISVCCIASIDQTLLFLKKREFKRIIFILIFLLLLFINRFYMAVFLAFALICTLFFIGSGSLIKRLAYSTAFFLALFVLGFLIGGHNTLREAYTQVGGLGHLQSSAEKAGQKKQYSTSIIKSFGAKSFIISGVHYVLSPSPINPGAGGLYRLLTVGSIYWYFLLSFLLGGIVYVFSNNMKEFYPIIFFILFCVMLYALVPTLSEPRHRMQMTHLSTLVSTVGLCRSYSFKGFLASWSVAFIIAGFVIGEMVRRGMS